MKLTIISHRASFQNNVPRFKLTRIFLTVDMLTSARSRLSCYVFLLVLFMDYGLASRKSHTTYITEYLNDWCGQKQISMSSFGMLKLWSNKLPSQNCTVSYDASSFTTLTDTSVSLAIETTAGCASNNPPLLHIYDGLHTGDGSSLVTTVMLNTRWSGELFYHTGRYLTFQYVHRPTTHACIPNVSIRFTKFIEANNKGCEDFVSYAYECSNARCINDKLECDGYNNCGNNNDETGIKCLTTDVIVVIVITIIIVSIFLCCCCFSCISARYNQHWPNTSEPGQVSYHRLRRRLRLRDPDGDPVYTDDEMSLMSDEPDLPYLSFPGDSQRLSHVNPHHRLVLSPPPYYAVVRQQVTSEDPEDKFVVCSCHSTDPPPEYTPTENQAVADTVEARTVADTVEARTVDEDTSTCAAGDHSPPSTSNSSLTSPH